MTREPEPAAALTVFGGGITQARRLVDCLLTTGVERGLLGPREHDRIWTRHVLNCAVIGDLVPRGVTVIDLGSGAGLPGLVLAIARPDLDVVLVEPLERRVAWLNEVVTDLDCDVRVVRARAEEIAGHEQAHVVTARAVAPLERLVGWGLPLLAPGGELLAIKGRGAAAELAACSGFLRRRRVSGAEVTTCGTGLLAEPTTVIRVPSPRAW